jgi:hypothetical protein
MATLPASRPDPVWTWWSPPSCAIVDETDWGWDGVAVFAGRSNGGSVLSLDDKTAD